MSLYTRSLASSIRRSLTTNRRYAVPSILCNTTNNTVVAHSNALQTLRCFSTERLRNIRSELIQGITDDINDLSYNNNNEESSTEISEYIKENQWEIEFDEANNDYYLTKKIQNTEITVNFPLMPDENESDDIEHFDDYADNDSDNNTVQQNNNEQVEGSEQGKVLSHNINITLEPGENQFVRLYGMADRSGSLQLSSIILDAGVAEQVEADDTMYGTAVYQQNEIRFHDLIEPVQDSLRDFLEELGIDDRLALFVQQYTYQQRTEQQIQKMRRLMNVIENVAKQQ